ncbi:glycosyltransferase family 4 protein [Flavobacterium sp. N1994]|uniref:glycosyltransferase family 4 protein n=1 Tax=Flavobacterium sp. N1994 TaxID=2986827 RepID=UPI002221D11F|nr:glycosyltransferase family 4 protein [Flavobacterium sp. N1994]
MKKNVLIINQSAELYGADKALLELLQNYPEDYNPIVVLHEEGPLKKILEELGIQVIKSSVIKVKRGVLNPSFFIALPFDIIRSILHIKKELKGQKVAFVHSNAISVFIGAFYSFFLRKKHLWHVHEIIVHPEKLAKWYPKIVSFFSDKIVFNSKATAEQFKKNCTNIEKKSVIVYNGQNRNQSFSTYEETEQIRLNEFKLRNNSIVAIGLVGRISRLKGQQVLLKSFKKLCSKYPNIHLVYIGSTPPGQDYYLDKLKAKIEEYGLFEYTTILDFKQNIWPYYDALDIVVVPSTEPESFGLVATESMLSKRPVVASKLGGLQEIILHGETGYLFESGNSADLCDQLEKLIENPSLCKTLGEKGQERVKICFSTKNYVGGIKSVYDSM